MKEQFSEEQNRLKYGEPQNDLIAQEFSFNEEFGVLFCLAAIKRYAKRFDSTSEKGQNEADIKKIIDYCNRVIYYDKLKYNFYTPLFEELKELVLNNQDCLNKCNEIRLKVYKVLTY